MTTIGEASLRPGDIVHTEEFRTLRVVFTHPKAFYGFKVADGSPVLRLVNYEQIEEYRPRERVDDEEVRAELFDWDEDDVDDDRDEWEDRLPSGEDHDHHTVTEPADAADVDREEVDPDEVAEELEDADVQEAADDGGQGEA